MDSDRATKRRKLDTTTQNSQTKSASKPRANAVGELKEQAANGTVAASSPNPDGAKTGHQIWLEAKAKREMERKINTKRRKTLNSEDGSAAGSASGTPASQAPKSAVGKLRAKKAALDPLQNQRTATSAPKPRQPALKGKGSVGFFKQFLDPGAIPPEKPTNAANLKMSGRKTQNEPTGGDDMGDEIAVSSGGRAKRTSARHNTNGAKTEEAGSVDDHPAPKKTYEDEIRELEEVARQEAGKDNTGGGSARGTPRRSAGRRSETRDTLPTRAAVKNAPNSTPVGRKLIRKPLPDSSPARVVVFPSPEEEADNSVSDGSYSDSDDSMADPPVPVLNFSKPAPASPEKDTLPKTFLKLKPAQLRSLQGIALARATGQQPIPLIGLEDEYAKLHTVTNQTITAGESNSMLLIGARGSGKTALLNQVIREQSKLHASEFHVVRLNGFIHTDDKIALREIWRQLGREMELDEDESSTRNYADTLATLLALLSHPAELGQEQAPGQVTKSVIFILDEFELFASHPRQTLLYNLFDIAQSRKAPIAVLGLTTRFDVAEALEKRVKSRFSHRYVHLGLAKSFNAYGNICKAAMCMLDTDWAMVGSQPGAADGSFKSNLQLRKPADDKLDERAMEMWNDMMDHLFDHPAVVSHLSRIYYTTKSIPEFLTSMLVPLSTLPTSEVLPSVDFIAHITTSLTASLGPPDSKLSLLASLGTLQLALLICAARQTAIHATDLVSFNLAYEEYKTLASKAKLQATASGALGAGTKVWGKDVAKDAWMALLDLGLVIEDGRSGGTGRIDVALEEIGGSGVELGMWARWCKEI